MSSTGRELVSRVQNDCGRPPCTGRQFADHPYTLPWESKTIKTMVDLVFVL